MRTVYCSLIVHALLLATPVLAAERWSQFRGEAGQGHATASDLPLTWSEDSSNLAWKVDVAGLGWSSPVVANGQVWLTTATDEGLSLRAVAFDLQTGNKLRDVEVFRLEEAGKIHAKNSHASPTPILDNDRVYVHFGRYGTACLDTSGKILWRQELQYKHVHGPGGSPVLVGDLLIVNCDGGDQQYVAALDCHTGEVRWQVPRPENSYVKKFAFSTPLVTEFNGATQVISPGAGGVTSLDPKTGTAIWPCDYPQGYSVVPRPVFGHGLVYVSSGFDKPTLSAIRADGTGDVTESHVEWQESRGAPRNASPLLIDDKLYLVSDNGVATCLDARNGKLHWQERLGGNCSASPIVGAGRIYIQNEAGVTTVLKPGKEFQKLARNELPGRAFASPAAIEGALLIRTEKSLYRIDAEQNRVGNP